MSDYFHLSHNEISSRLQGSVLRGILGSIVGMFVCILVMLGFFLTKRSLGWIVLYDREFKTLAKVDSHLEDLDRLKVYLASYGIKM